MNQPLAALANPDPSLTTAHLRHIQSELDPFLAHDVGGRRLVEARSARLLMFLK